MNDPSKDDLERLFNLLIDHVEEGAISLDFDDAMFLARLARANGLDLSVIEPTVTYLALDAERQLANWSKLAKQDIQGKDMYRELAERAREQLARWDVMAEAEQAWEEQT